MKNLFSLKKHPFIIILFLSSTLSFSQCELPSPFTGNTGSVFTVMLTSGFVSSLPITNENAYLVAFAGNDLVVGSTNLYGVTQMSIAVWGDDTFTPVIDGALAGESISFQLVNGSDLYDVVMPTAVAYTTNGMGVQVSPGTVTEAYCPIYICSNPNYLEYYFTPEALDLVNSNTEELCTTPITNGGITTEMFIEPLNTGANMTIPMPAGMLQQFEGGQIAAFSNGLCVGLETITSGFIAMGLWGDDSSTDIVVDGMLAGEVPSFAVLYNGGVISLDQNEMTGYTTNDIAAISNFQITEPVGCTASTACNYVLYALVDDGSCIYAEEYYDCEGMCILDTDEDGVCDELEIPGCTEWGYTTYNPLATDNDGSCTLTWEEEYVNLGLSLSNTIDSLQTSYNLLDSIPIIVDLNLGWNIIGYTNTYEQDVVEALEEVMELILVFKDNNADVYMPEYGFNGIGNLKPGQGYQIKLSESYDSFSFEGTPIFGCTYEIAANYNTSALIDDGSCTIPCVTPQSYHVGDMVEGGIVFYVDETGQHGLVSATDDLLLGSTEAFEGYYGFEWGCHGEYVPGADANWIGAGLQNTVEISEQDCETYEAYGVSAAQAIFSTYIEGYSDWYLPSRAELYQMYLNIGQGGLNNNLGNFQDQYYWSSTEYLSHKSWAVHFNSGVLNANEKWDIYLVRPIRSF